MNDPGHDERAAARRAVPDVSSQPIESLVQSRSPEVLLAAASDVRLGEDLALALLARQDLSERVLDLLSKNRVAMKSRKVLNALLRHPRTPRHVSLPIARRMYTFELMQLTLTPSLAADLKMVAEESIIARLETVSAGERLSLARQASTRVVAMLLIDPELRVVEAALHNSHLTEQWVVKALMRDEAPAHFVATVCKHPKWSMCWEVRLALLRNRHTPLARAIVIADSLPPAQVRDVLANSRLPDNVRAYLEQQVQRRK